MVIKLEGNGVESIVVNVLEQKIFIRYRICDSVNTKLRSGGQLELDYSLSNSLVTEAIKKVKEKEGIV